MFHAFSYSELIHQIWGHDFNPTWIWTHNKGNAKLPNNMIVYTQFG